MSNSNSTSTSATPQLSSVDGNYTTEDAIVLHSQIIPGLEELLEQQQLQQHHLRVRTDTPDDASSLSTSQQNSARDSSSLSLEQRPMQRNTSVDSPVTYIQSAPITPASIRGARAAVGSGGFVSTMHPPVSLRHQSSHAAAAVAAAGNTRADASSSSSITSTGGVVEPVNNEEKQEMSTSEMSHRHSSSISSSSSNRGAAYPYPHQPHSHQQSLPLTKLARSVSHPIQRDELPIAGWTSSQTGPDQSVTGMPVHRILQPANRHQHVYNAVEMRRIESGGGSRRGGGEASNGIRSVAGGTSPYLSHANSPHILSYTSSSRAHAHTHTHSRMPPQLESPPPSPKANRSQLISAVGEGGMNDSYPPIPMPLPVAAMSVNEDVVIDVTTRSAQPAASAAPSGTAAASSSSSSTLPSQPLPASSGGGHTPLSPPSFMSQLSASFLERIPLSLKSSTRGLKEGNILLAPMIDRNTAGVGSAGVSPNVAFSMGGGNITTPVSSNAPASASTPASTSSNSMLSLAEMAEQARTVKKLGLLATQMTPGAQQRLLAGNTGAQTPAHATSHQNQQNQTRTSRSNSIRTPAHSSSSAALHQQHQLHHHHALSIGYPPTRNQVNNIMPPPLLDITTNLDSMKAALGANATIAGVAATAAAGVDTPAMSRHQSTGNNTLGVDHLRRGATGTSGGTGSADSSTQLSSRKESIDFSPSPLQLPKARDDDHALQQQQQHPSHQDQHDHALDNYVSLTQSALIAAAHSTPQLQYQPSSSLYSNEYDAAYYEEDAPPSSRFQFSSSMTSTAVASATVNSAALTAAAGGSGSGGGMKHSHSTASLGRHAELELPLSPSHVDDHGDSRLGMIPSPSGGADFSSTGVVGISSPNDAAELGLGCDITPWQIAKDEQRVIEIFLEEMGSALFSCGLPMHVVNFYLVLVAHRLNVDIEVVAINTYFWITFLPSTVCHMVVPKNPGLSLSKMVHICQVSERILHGMCSPVEGLAELQTITRAPSTYPTWSIIPAMSLVCFFYAPLFNSGWTECFVAAICGFLIGCFEIYSSAHTSLARGHDLLSGFIAGVLAILCHSYITKINLLAAVFGSIVWVLPGLRVTMSMLDLSTGNPVTGTSKFFSSIITAINLGIGAVAGISIGKLTGAIDSTENLLQSSSYGHTPEWFLPLCIIGTTFPSLVLLDAKLSHTPQYIIGSATAFYLSSYLSQYVGSAFGTWLAAAAVGIMGNCYGRWTTNPAIELTLWSILMLVPGSIGVRSVLANDSLSQVGFLQQMITIAIAIVTGLFTANVVVPPLRAL